MLDFKVRCYLIIEILFVMKDRKLLIVNFDVKVMQHRTHHRVFVWLDFNQMSQICDLLMGSQLGSVRSIMIGYFNSKASGLCRTKTGPRTEIPIDISHKFDTVASKLFHKFDLMASKPVWLLF